MQLQQRRQMAISVNMGSGQPAFVGAGHKKQKKPPRGVRGGLALGYCLVRV
jgi:hypothetical protein